MSITSCSLKCKYKFPENNKDYKIIWKTRRIVTVKHSFILLYNRR